MLDEEELMITETDNKPKRDEVVQGCRKRHQEDDIRPEKREHSSMVSRRTRNPEGFNSKDWDESKQKDEWHIPDIWQRILQMVFCGRWYFVADVRR